MRRWLLAFVVVLLATTPPANYCISRATLVSQVAAGALSWKSSAPAGWSTDQTQVTWTDFTTYVANTGSCVQPAGSTHGLMSWSQMVACAQNHIASQQSESVSGNYSTVYYTATFDSSSSSYSCHGPKGVDAYSGTPIMLPAGTVAPSSSTPLTLNLSSITWTGSTQLTATLKDPSGSTVYTRSVTTPANSLSITWTTSGPAGAWSWVITQVGGSAGACDSVNGVTDYGGTQVQWSGTASWWQ